MPMSPDERENWGEIRTRVQHLEDRVKELREGQALTAEHGFQWRIALVTVVSGAVGGVLVTVVTWLLSK